MPPPSVVPTVYSPLVPSTATNQRAISGEPSVQGYEKSTENAMSQPVVSLSIQQTAPSAIAGTDAGTVLVHDPPARPLQLHQDFPPANSVYPLESQTLLPSIAQTQAFQLPFQTMNLQSISHGAAPSSTASALRPATLSNAHGPSSTPPSAPSSDPIGRTIVSVAKLYQLPVEELECAVADILREPGFEEFVCNRSEPSKDINNNIFTDW